MAQVVTEHPAVIEAKRRMERRAKGLKLTDDYEPADRMTLTLMGPPRSKKNHTVTHGVQSPAYRKYKADALDQLRFVKKLKDIDLNLEAHFYVDGWGKAADLVGLIQGLADVLQNAGVVTNDKQFKGLDRSRVHEDHGTAPRTEISITPL
jgi:Holliday junction resolvase RusA-like endonuclease